jgi:hypothetical protein
MTKQDNEIVMLVKRTPEGYETQITLDKSNLELETAHLARIFTMLIETFDEQLQKRFQN